MSQPPPFRSRLANEQRGLYLVHGSRGQYVRTGHSLPRVETPSLTCMLRCHRLGPVALATQSVLLVSGSTTYQAPFALSVATSVR